MERASGKKDAEEEDSERGKENRIKAAIGTDSSVAGRTGWIIGRNDRVSVSVCGPTLRSNVEQFSRRSHAMHGTIGTPVSWSL